HGHAIESVQHDVGRRYSRCWPGEVAVRTLVHTVEAEIHGREAQASPAFRARSRVGGVGQLTHGHSGILAAEPQRRPRQRQADLSDPWIVSVEHSLPSL